MKLQWNKSIFLLSLAIGCLFYNPKLAMSDQIGQPEAIITIDPTLQVFKKPTGLLDKQYPLDAKELSLIDALKSKKTEYLFPYSSLPHNIDEVMKNWRLSNDSASFYKFKNGDDLMIGDKVFGVPYGLPAPAEMAIPSYERGLIIGEEREAQLNCPVPEIGHHLKATSSAYTVICIESSEFRDKQYRFRGMSGFRPYKLGRFIYLPPEKGVEFEVLSFYSFGDEKQSVYLKSGNAYILRLYEDGSVHLQEIERLSVSSVANRQ